MFALFTPAEIMKSPSLRGSGLKLQWTARCQTAAASPSLRGSGLKLKLTLLSPRCAASPSLRGSGLKLSLRLKRNGHI